MSLSAEGSKPSALCCPANPLTLHLYTLMSLDLTLERQTSQPLYRQIADHVRDRIADGALPPGTQLPTVRAMAAQLGVTRLTVQTAYAELQSGGWVEATTGRGTFVSAAAQAARHIANRTVPFTADVVIDDMIHIGHVAGMRSMANASPDPRLAPTDEFWHVLADMRPQASVLTEYGAIQGDAELRIELSTLLRERGVQAIPGDILVTDGATQALSLLTQALCRQGDTVLVEQPTYLSFLNLARMHGVQAVAVPLDDQGPEPEALERLVVQMRPRFLYTIPTFHNPTGRNVSVARRRTLLELAARYGFLLVEDDIYARIAYDGPPPPTLMSMDEAESVVYVSSFSKTLMPGLRIGYVVAPPALQRRLLDLRRASDLCGPPLLQRAVAEYVRRDGIKRYLRKVLPIYRERRDALLGALAATMPPGVRWTQPEGGFCCWLTLPPHPIYDDLYAAALRQGWAFAPGSVFQAPGGEAPEQALRICFGQQEPAAIRSGVGVLAQLIRARMEAAGRLDTRVPDWSPLV